MSYKENADISVVRQDRNGEMCPVGLHFENNLHNFKNDYRFMTSEVVAEKLKSPKFRGVTWHIEFEPMGAWKLEHVRILCINHLSIGLGRQPKIQK